MVLSVHMNATKILELCKSQLFRDSLWAILGNAIGKALSLAVGIFIAKFLGSSDYGLYGMIKSTLIYISIFSTLGLGITSTKYVSEYKEYNIQKLNSICQNLLLITMVIGLLMAIVLLFFANQIANYLEAPETIRILRFSSVAIFFNSLNSTQTGIMSGFKAFKQVSKNSILTGVFTCFAGTILTYYYKLEGAVVALTLAYIFNCVLNTFTLNKLRRKFPPSLGYDKIVIKKMLVFSFPIALQEGLQSISQWTIIAVLVKLASFAELGIFNATGQWTAIISFIPSMLKNVTLSYLSDNKCNHHKIVNMMVMINTAVSSVILLIIYLSSDLIDSFYGKSFEGLGSVLNLMIFSTTLGSIGSVYVQELISQSHNWLSFMASFGKSCLIIILGATLILYLNVSGAMAFAYATLLSNAFFLTTLVLFYNSKR